jgi:hypothetical protein
MVGSLSVATIAMWSAKVAVVVSAVYSRYSNGLRTLPWGYALVHGEEFCVLIFFVNEEVSSVQVGLGNSLGAETVLVCTVIRYAILC